METFILPILAILILLYLLVFYFRTKLDKLELKAFKSTNSELSPQEKKFYIEQLKKYSNQQSMAFILLCISILFSLGLGVFIIYKKIIEGGADVKWLKAGIGLAGGIGISASTFKLYKTTTQKVDDIMKKIK